MAHTYYGTSTNASYASGVSLPDDGDLAAVASINPALQAVVDRTQYLADRIPNGMMIGGSGLWIFPGANTVYIRAISALWLGGSVYFGNTTFHSATFSSLMGNTFYQIYVGISGSSLVFSCQTDPPDPSLTYPLVSGVPDTSKRYIGTVRTIGGGTFLPMTMSHGRCTWRRSAVNSPTLLELALTSSQIAVQHTLTWVPSHARTVDLDVHCVNTHATPQTVVLTTGTDTGSAAQLINVAAQDGTYQTDVHRPVTLDVGVNGSFSYVTSHADCSVAAWCNGWSE